ncbi:MAG: amidohydrolase [Chitinophagales bacterium]|nr:amidohydrolase [Chitinophagales bacterium]
MQDLTVTLVQADLLWENIEGNHQRIEQLLSNTGQTDLVVLPETFATGFTMNTHISETMDGASITWMRRMAKEKDSVITGSLIIKENGNVFNRLIWMRPDGSHEQYDKRHRFGLGGEQESFTAGKGRVIVELKGWRICPIICYDLRFPVWCRNQNDYDTLLVVANWPEKRSYAWKQLLIARAIENQAYVVAANRVGNDGIGISCVGDSRIIDPMGEILFMNKGQQIVHTALLSASYLQETRSKLPFLNDRDSFEIQL